MHLELALEPVMEVVSSRSSTTAAEASIEPEDSAVDVDDEVDEDAAAAEDMSTKALRS